MAMAPIRVTAGGKTVTVEPTGADMVAWERYARSQKIPQKLDHDDFPRVTYVTYLGYAAGKRTGQWTTGFESWLETFEGSESVEDPGDDEGK